MYFVNYMHHSQQNDAHVTQTASLSCTHD